MHFFSESIDKKEFISVDSITCYSFNYLSSGKKSNFLSMFLDF